MLRVQILPEVAWINSPGLQVMGKTSWQLEIAKKKKKVGQTASPRVQEDVEGKL